MTHLIAFLDGLSLLAILHVYCESCSRFAPFRAKIHVHIQITVNKSNKLEQHRRMSARMRKA